MANQKLSLQEQLLKSGLVSSAKAKTAKTDKRKQAEQQRKNNVVVTDEAKELALKAQAEQQERDRALNQLKIQQEAQKHLAAQIKQLIELNKLPINDADGLAYHFNDQNKMKTLYVSANLREQLIRGRAAVVKAEGGYEVVSSDVAEKISQRDAASVIVLNAPSAEPVDRQDDPYADYQIPDDLMW